MENRALIASMLVACTTLGCRREKAPSQTRLATPSASSAPSQPAPTSPAPKPSLVELLHSTHAMVAVSSSVKNQVDRPEGAFDGSPKTAWNSRTGDLVGAWIAFRVPASSRVHAIKMTAGFTHSSGKDDLFAMNHRVRRIRIRNDSTVFASAGPETTDASAPQTPPFTEERELDTENRDLQSLSVDLPGGDYVVEVLDVVPGTKKAWREVAISEFQVWGTLPNGQAPAPQAPIVRVGTAHTLTMNAALGPYDSIDAYCAEFLAKVGTGVGGVAPMTPACALEEPKVIANDRRFKTVGFVNSNEGGDHVLLKLAMQTERGWFVAHLKKFGGAHPGCGGKFYGEDLTSRSFAIDGSPAGSLLVAKATVATEFGMEVTPEEARDYGVKSFRAESHETTAVFCGIGKNGTPACSSELRTAFASKRTPAETTEPAEESLASFVVKSTSAIEVRFERGNAKSVAEEGHYSLDD